MDTPGRSAGSEQQPRAGAGGARLLERRVEAAGPLVQGTRAGLGEREHLGVGRHDDDLDHAAGRERGRDRAAEQPLDEVAALLGVQHRAQARLRALEGADGIATVTRGAAGSGRSTPQS